MLIRTIAALAVVCAMFVPAEAARNTAKAKRDALAQFSTAEKMREALNGSPTPERTRRDYQRVTDAYRRVYYIAPFSSRADAAVLAVAELLAETGREFSDEKMLRAAIGQYEFLRREYPGSRYRFDALFTIGQIYKEDLHDKDAAKATLQEFLKRYPRHRLAEDARTALVEIDNPPKRRKEQKTEGAKHDDTREKDNRVAEVKTSRLPLVTGVRHWSTPDYTRVAIDLEGEVRYEAGRIPNPARIFFDIHDTKLASTLIGKSFDVQDGFLRKIRVAQYQLDMTRVVLEVDDISEYSAFLLPNPYRLIIDIHGKKSQKSAATVLARKEAPAKVDTEPSKQADPAVKKITDLETTLKKVESEEKAEDATITVAKSTEPELKATQAPTSQPTFESVSPRETKATAAKSKRKAPGRQARPTSSGETSLIRALGLKIGRIVVDAGHGGHDTGTIGPSGLQEKDLVLDVALRLGKLLDTKLGAEVVYTRDDDTFIPLETRTAVANREQADLFISIHANSSSDPAARGIETYYLNFTSSAEALDVAARENAVSEKSIHELQDLVKKITLKDKIDESREFAAEVQKSLHTGVSAKSPGIRNRGVKKAPFIVLIGANMPSVLAEISFLSNPTDERKLQTPEWRQRIADHLYRGISKYISGLSGVKTARGGVE